MALPTPADLGTLEYVFNGVPFAAVPGNSSVDTGTLEYVLMGVPFQVAKSGIAPTYNTTQFFMVF